ncbi:MAG: hypothetical protein ACTSQS_10025 [Promethearchaeota archaeon]
MSACFSVLTCFSASFLFSFFLTPCRGLPLDLSPYYLRNGNDSTGIGYRYNTCAPQLLVHARHRPLCNRELQIFETRHP